MADSEESQLAKKEFLCKVLKNIPDTPKVEWAAVAVEAGIEKAENARKKFKRILGEAGYELRGDQVVKPSEKEEEGVTEEAKKAATSRKRKAAAKKGEDGSASKLAKVAQSVIDPALPGAEKAAEGV